MKRMNTDILGMSEIKWKDKGDFWSDNYRVIYSGDKNSNKGVINYQHGVLLISVGANEGHFEGKPPRKVTKGALFLHVNAPAHQAHATRKKLAYLGFQCLDHPPYFPDLAPSDYHLFSGLKNQLKCRHFSSDAVIAAAVTWLDGQISEFLFLVACKS